MADLIQSLHRFDLGYLRSVAELWGIELGMPGEGESLRQEILQSLTAGMTRADKLQEIVTGLPEEARRALDDLVRNGGRLTWSRFTHRYGRVREMGAGRRDREQPHLNPTSPAEVLWYRALVGRAFLDTPAGPQEFAYIPDDLLALLPLPAAPGLRTPLGRPASLPERAHPILASDRLLDHACTMLAALRVGLALDSKEFQAGSWEPAFPYAPPPHAVQALLACADLIDPATNLPRLENTRRFLEDSRENALALLARSWRQSTTFNELRMLPGLRFEGNWQNSPLQARETILNYLSAIPPQTWWSLASFIAAVKETHPDFQRPSGDYDSWYISDAASGNYLRGFENWDRIDGALIHYLIGGPLHWLGIVDLASASPGAAPSAFRTTTWAPALLQGAPPPGHPASEGMPSENEAIVVSSNGRLRVPRLAPRAARYQVARFCTWENTDEAGYSYRITHTSLLRAREQGLNITHILSLLRQHTQTIPPNLIKALERWYERGSEARLERALILRLRTPAMLQALRNSRAARFLGDPLAPTVVIVKPGAWAKVMDALAEMGYLAESEELEQEGPQ